MHLPEQNAVVCTVPKAGCTTVREIAYDLEGETDSIKSREQDPRGFDIHSWWFGHKRNLKNMRPSAAMRLMKNASGRARGRSMRNDGRNRVARERSSRPRGERRSGKRSRL